MDNVVGNPASPRITSAARNAYAKAGESIHGQAGYWARVPMDPGKSVFWRNGLIECGVDANVAYRIVEDLNRNRRAW